ncbi:response regulator [Pantoea sp. KXB25]|uniref:response regulator n=1 Tax=unclassified Pantoea TaxID=2630326 RepID=UPI003AB7E6F4
MDTPNKNLKKVIDLFERKGIDKRKQASTMADILGIKYQSAKQKLDGKRGIFYSELKSVYNYFYESLEEAKPYNGIFIVNDMHVRCNIVVSDDKVEIKDPGINYAYFHKNYYVVNPTGVKFNKDMKRVIRMDFLPAPKLAILDNDKELLELIKSVSNRYGIDASVYETAQDMMQAIDREDYDGYVIDWLLDYNENSEAVIKKIRSKSETVPIILLTGQLNQHEREIGEIIVEYGVELVEKPTRVFILSSILLAHLFF